MRNLLFALWLKFMSVSEALEINIHLVDALDTTLMIYHLFVSTVEKSGSFQWLCKQCITYRRRAQATIFNYVDVDLFRGTARCCARCYDRWWKPAFQFVLKEPSRRAHTIVDVFMINDAFHNLSNAVVPEIQLHNMALIGKVLPVIMKILFDYFSCIFDQYKVRHFVNACVCVLW